MSATTSTATSRALTFARPVVLGLTVLNLLYIVSLLALLIGSFLVDGWPQRPLGNFDSDHPLLPAALRGIIVIGAICGGIVHIALRQLLAIVDTVRVGDPFILDNARRLERIAWCVLTLEVMRLVVMAIASTVWESGRLTSFTLGPWLAVLMLFVLSGVFAHGARMRADLEGTV